MYRNDANRSNGLFGNTQENLQFLKKRKSKILARWDESDDIHHCHHEKTWILDAGEVHTCIKIKLNKNSQVNVFLLGEW